MKLRAARGKIALSGFVALVAAATSAVGLVATPAGAAPSTKSYTATVGDTATTAASVTYPTSSQTTATTQTLFVTLANSPGSNQSFGSADIDLLHDWNWKLVGITTTTSAGPGAWAAVSAVDQTNHRVIHLRNNGVGSQAAIPAGKSISVQLTFSTPDTGGIVTPGLVVKQSNDFSDSSTKGTSNVFAALTPVPVIYVGGGPPTQLVYSRGPSDVQVTTSAATNYICPPVTAAVEDALGNVVSWLPQTSVTLSSTGTPGLQLNGSTTLSANTSSGVATFGTSTSPDVCTGGLTASNQGTYDLTASTTVAAGVGYAGGTFSTSAASFTVYLTLCSATCDVPLTGDQTDAGIHATGGDGTSTPVIGLITGAGTLPTGCVNAHITYRPSQTILLLDGHDKTVTVAWSKKVTNLDPRNGTPFWPVCIQGPYLVYVSASSGGAVLGSAADGALLAPCSAAGVVQRVAPANPGPDHACVQSLFKNAASEHAVIWVPDQPGDPHLW